MGSIVDGLFGRKPAIPHSPFGAQPKISRAIVDTGKRVEFDV
jgi:hypothetical protein